MADKKDWKYFDDLKKQCAQDLRKAGHKAPKVGKLRRLPNAVEWQATNEVPANEALGIDYQDYMARTTIRTNFGEPVEDIRANPDALPEGSGFFDRAASSESVDIDPSSIVREAKAHDLIRKLKGLLSKRQYQVYEMHIEDGLNFEDIAIRLGVRSSGIRYAWKIAQDKIKRAFSSMERGHV